MHYVLIMSGKEVLYLQWEYLMLRLLLSEGCLRALQGRISILSLVLSLSSICRLRSFFSISFSPPPRPPPHIQSSNSLNTVSSSVSLHLSTVAISSLASLLETICL